LSTWDARLADRLSREATTTAEDRRLLESFQTSTLPKSLENWLENPVEDFSLAERLLEEVERRVR
jgi:hypothetical protein